MNNEALIAEARRQVGHIEDKSMRERLISDLANALEAATRVPVQGEPNEHCCKHPKCPGDSLCCCQGEPNVCLDHKPVQHRDGKPPWCNTCGRASVPDAATEELRPDEMTANEAIELVLKRPGMYGLVPKNEHRSMKVERDAALDRIADLEEALSKECRDLASTTEHTAAAMGSLRLTMGEAMVKFGYEGLRQKLSRTEARITEAAKLHQCFETHNGFQWCSGCSSDEYPEDWPCPTAVALGLNEGEER